MHTSKTQKLKSQLVKIMNTVDRVQKQQMKRRGVISKNDDKIESLLAKFNAIEDKIEESMIIPQHQSRFHFEVQIEELDTTIDYITNTSQNEFEIEDLDSTFIHDVDFSIIDYTEDLDMTIEKICISHLDESDIISVNTDDSCYIFQSELNLYEKDLINIYKIIIDGNEHESQLVIGASKFIAQQRKLTQKRGEVLNKKFNILKQSGHQAIKVGGQIIVTARKIKLNVQDLDKIERHGGYDAQLNFKNKIRILTSNIQGVMNVTSKMHQNKIFGAGFGLSIKIKKGDKSFDIMNPVDYNIKDNDPAYSAAKWLMSEEYFYNDDQDIVPDTHVIAQFTSGLIGDKKSIKQLQNKNLIVSPMTVSQCIPDCIALLNYIASDQTAVNVFAVIKEQSKKISQKYKLSGGGSMIQLREICETLNYQVYDINDKQMPEAGVIVVQQHCVAVLPRTDRNEMVAEVLQRQYQNMADRIIGVNNGIVEQYKTLRNRDTDNTVYITYDFEWTYQQKQLDDENNRIVDQHAYAYTYWVFQGGNNGEQPQKYFGLDCYMVFAQQCKMLSERYNDKNLVFFAHNGMQADLPMFMKELPKYFSKDQTDFASKMSTISSNWNVGKQMIKFQNSMNLFPCMSLKTVGETYCPEQAQKLDCDHSKINLDNWESERIRQNLDQYAINDVVVLGNALINYDEMIYQRYGFPILHQNNIMSNSSLALKVFLACYYKPLETAIYTIPEEYLDACKQAYHGGSVQLFFRGYRNNTKIFAIDINSSYPAQMLKQFPIGPYRDVEMCNVKYSGQQIQMGLYQIFIEDSPVCECPVFFTQIDGVSQPSNVRNHTMWVTSVELQYAYQCGYTKIYMIKAIISANVGQPFEQYINEHYQQRCDAKQLRDQHPEGSAQWAKYEALQGIAKNAMNSLYGKMAASQSRDIVKELTTNSTLILNMAKTGLLEQCDEIKFDGSDKTFYQIGGIQETSTKNVNMMVGAFTTAYGRIKLNQIQRDVLKHGFRLLYSDTDSVYFEVGEHMTTNSQINTAMDTLGKIQCHKTQIGMSKYETADDVGNCLQITNLHKQSDDENLRYSYADQGVFLAPKSYAIRSTTTGQALLKAKGVPEYLIKKSKYKSEDEAQASIKRAQWNKNESQFVFEDFIRCAIENVPFNYSVIQFMNRKQNMTDSSKSNMKDGLKMNKTVRMEFKNKHVAKSGKCIPKTLNGYMTIEKRETFTNGFGNEGYITFNTIEEVKQHFNLDNTEKYQLFRQNHNIIRNENGNVFTVFESYSQFVEFFNEKIVNNPVKCYHMVNCTDKQLVQFDVDISCDNMKTIMDLEVDMSSETIEKAFRELMMIPTEIKCEIINRSRQTKISYHIRFACNSDAITIKHMLMNTKVKYPLLSHIDVNIYTNSLRMTQSSSEFLYNPENMNYVSGTMTKKLVEQIQKKKQTRAQDLKPTMKKIQDKNAEIQVQKDLVENGLAQYFKFNKLEIGNGKKMVAYLYRQKGSECKQCTDHLGVQTRHEKDNTHIIEYDFDNRLRKQTTTIKCFRQLEHAKANK